MATSELMDERIEPVAVPVVVRPSWRGRMHTWAAGLAALAAVPLIDRAHGAAARASAAVFVASLVAVFATSAAYHRLPRTEATRRVMRRLDHSMIYLLIAGTYAPVCLVGMPRGWGVTVLVIITVGALVGMLRTLIAFDRLYALGITLYVVLGWTAVAALPVLIAGLTGAELFLIVLGGLLYTAGLPVLLTKRPNPWPKTFGYHEIWHVCTIAAAMCHFAGVYLLVTS